MALQTAVFGFGCASCRLWLLRSFTHGITTPTRISLLKPALPASLRSRFSSKVIRWNEHSETENQVHPVSTSQWKAQDPSQNQETLVDASSDPWYLQVQTPQRVPEVLADRQRIPDVPEFPPPIMQPLLQQISVDLGLDYLSLLDLRKLDPPPALGANLMMVIGTARSEKHLHVAADRLCRWLRSTYKLHPDADGLLGRNELKLKMRRKARRAKLLGRMPEDNGDDGIRTGWVCVDVGVVEASKEDTSSSEQKDFVGFGRRNDDGVRLVVQMLTEEKREEIELEKLWDRILQKNACEWDVTEPSGIEAPNSVHSIKPVDSVQASSSY